MVHRLSFSTSIRVAVLIEVLCLLRPVPSFSGPPIHFKLAEGHWIVVPITIKGTGPYEFILDTGSNQSILSPSLITESDGKMISQKRLVTATGSELVPCFRVEDFQFGLGRVEYLDVLAQPVPEKIGFHIRGILGQDYLSRFNFILDYKSRTVNFEENREFSQNLRGMVYTLLESSYRRLVMIPPQSTASRPSLFVLDSAAERVILFGNNFIGLGFDLASSGGLEILQTVTGRELLNGGRFRTFRVGETTFRNMPVTLARPGDLLKHRLENGLLPTSCFQSIYINNEDKFVAFNPRFENPPKMDEK